MIQTIQVQGTEKRLIPTYCSIGDESGCFKLQIIIILLKRTEQYVWFIAIDKNTVVGFMPVEHRRSGCVINNYYVSGDNRETLSLLISSVLEAIGKEVRLFAVVMVNHQAVFEEHGFIMEKAWKRYVKMQKDE